MQWYLGVLKKYATFEGRARRKEYWMFTLFNFLVIVLLAIIGAATGGNDGGSIIVNLYQLAVFLPSLAVGVRRMHDTEHSGWWIIVPIANLIFACREGTSGSNPYGPDPKAEGGIDVAAFS